MTVAASTLDFDTQKAYRGVRSVGCVLSMKHHVHIHTPRGDAMTTKKPAARKKKEVLTVEYAEVYRDARGEWRWRAKAANHKIVSEGGEGYNNRMYARKVVASLFPGVRIVFV